MFPELREACSEGAGVVAFDGWKSWEPAREAFQEHEAERVEIGDVAIAGSGRNPRGVSLSEDAEAFGCHVGEGAAGFGRQIGGLGPIDGEVEVEEHGDGERGDQDVGGFEVAVGDTAVPGGVEGISQPRDDPGDGMGVIERGDEVVGQGVSGLGREFRGADLLEGQEQIVARAAAAQRGQDLREAGATEEGHAEEEQGIIVGRGMGEDLDDMGVPGAGEQAGFERGFARNLEDDVAVVEIGLTSEEDAGEPTAAELAFQEIRSDEIADLGKRGVFLTEDDACDAGILECAMQADEAGQAIVQLGKPGEEDLGIVG